LPPKKRSMFSAPLARMRESPCEIAYDQNW
jgi:hypothetical protein